MRKTALYFLAPLLILLCYLQKCESRIESGKKVNDVNTDNSARKNDFVSSSEDEDFSASGFSEESEEDVSFSTDTESLSQNTKTAHQFGKRQPKAIDIMRKPFKLPAGMNSFAAPIFTRKRCQFDDGRLWPSATMCEDELGQEACESIFQHPADKEAKKGDEARSMLCHNPAMNDLVRRCARTCKVCCEVEKFSCVDSAAAIIDCSRHKDKCKDPSWHKIMRVACEHTCGLCDVDKCFDAAHGCHDLRHLCDHQIFGETMRQQCALTCRQCKQTTGKLVVEPLLPTTQGGKGVENATQKNDGTSSQQHKEILVVVRPGNETCEDKSPHCIMHRKMCHDYRYADLLMDRCAKTCKFCDENQASIPFVEVKEKKKNSKARKPLFSANTIDESLVESSEVSPKKRRFQRIRPLNVIGPAKFRNQRNSDEPVFTLSGELIPQSIRKVKVEPRYLGLPPIETKKPRKHHPELRSSAEEERESKPHAIFGRDVNLDGGKASSRTLEISKEPEKKGNLLNPNGLTFGLDGTQLAQKSEKSNKNDTVDDAGDSDDSESSDSGWISSSEEDQFEKNDDKPDGVINENAKEDLNTREKRSENNSDAGNFGKNDGEIGQIRDDEKSLGNDLQNESERKSSEVLHLKNQKPENNERETKSFILAGHAEDGQLDLETQEQTVATDKSEIDSKNQPTVGSLSGNSEDGTEKPEGTTDKTKTNEKEKDEIQPEKINIIQRDPHRGGRYGGFGGRYGGFGGRYGGFGGRYGGFGGYGSYSRSVSRENFWSQSASVSYSQSYSASYAADEPLEKEEKSETIDRNKLGGGEVQEEDESEANLEKSSGLNAPEENANEVLQKRQKRGNFSSAGRENGGPYSKHNGRMLRTEGGQFTINLPPKKSDKDLAKRSEKTAKRKRKPKSGRTVGDTQDDTKNAVEDDLEALIEEIDRKRNEEEQKASIIQPLAENRSQVGDNEDDTSNNVDGEKNSGFQHSDEESGSSKMEADTVSEDSNIDEIPKENDFKLAKNESMGGINKSENNSDEGNPIEKDDQDDNNSKPIDGHKPDDVMSKARARANRNKSTGTLVGIKEKSNANEKNTVDNADGEIENSESNKMDTSNSSDLRDDQVNSTKMSSNESNGPETLDSSQEFQIEELTVELFSDEDNQTNFSEDISDSTSRSKLRKGRYKHPKGTRRRHSKKDRHIFEAQQDQEIREATLQQIQTNLKFLIEQHEDRRNSKVDVSRIRPKEGSSKYAIVVEPRTGEINEDFDITPERRQLEFDRDELEYALVRRARSIDEPSNFGQSQSNQGSPVLADRSGLNLDESNFGGHNGPTLEYPAEQNVAEEHQEDEKDPFEQQGLQLQQKFGDLEATEKNGLQDLLVQSQFLNVVGEGDVNAITYDSAENSNLNQNIEPDQTQRNARILSRPEPIIRANINEFATNGFERSKDLDNFDHSNSSPGIQSPESSALRTSPESVLEVDNQTSEPDISDFPQYSSRNKADGEFSGLYSEGKSSENGLTRNRFELTSEKPNTVADIHLLRSLSNYHRGIFSKTQEGNQKQITGSQFSNLQGQNQGVNQKIKVQGTSGVNSRTVTPLSGLGQLQNLQHLNRSLLQGAHGGHRANTASATHLTNLVLGQQGLPQVLHQQGGWPTDYVDTLYMPWNGNAGANQGGNAGNQQGGKPRTSRWITSENSGKNGIYDDKNGLFSYTSIRKKHNDEKRQGKSDFSESNDEQDLNLAKEARATSEVNESELETPRRDKLSKDGLELFNLISSDFGTNLSKGDISDNIAENEDKETLKPFAAGEENTQLPTQSIRNVNKSRDVSKSAEYDFGTATTNVEHDSPATSNSSVGYLPKPGSHEEDALEEYFRQFPPPPPSNLETVNDDANKKTAKEENIFIQAGLRPPPLISNNDDEDDDSSTEEGEEEHENVERRPITAADLRAALADFLGEKAAAAKVPKLRRQNLEDIETKRKKNGKPAASKNKRKTQNQPLKNVAPHRFDGILRDSEGRPFTKGELDIRGAIEKIRRKYDVSSSSSATSIQEQDDSDQFLSDSHSNEGARSRKNLEKDIAKRFGNKRRKNYSSGSSEDENRKTSSLLAKEKQITSQLKEILHDLIGLKQSGYRDTDDRANRDLRRFLEARKKREKERQERIRKALLLREAESSDLYDIADSSVISSEENSRRKSNPRRSKRVLLIDNTRRGRYDPLTGGYIYDAGPAVVDVIGTSGVTSNSDRYGVVRSANGQVLPQVGGGPFAYGPRTPTRYNSSPQATTLFRPGVVVQAPRVTSGTAGNNVLLTTGGFTHVDVGTGFGPIAPELCKDYYP
ncbi:hypothetical protein DdX_06240 [Ditylenchus destructor]|uniref:ShKT domain-containing protein n=1 Tax=Ditylenchus destructor TaxID=166010 RepID=A0AAD4N784_9BILA|nr:hypothetical protein DdX_06240 [Ditylenchus destructor]